MTAADRICEIFDAEIDIVDGTETLDDPRGRVRFDRRRVPLPRRRRRRAARHQPGDRSPGRPWPSSAPPDRARRSSPQLVAAALRRDGRLGQHRRRRRPRPAAWSSCATVVATAFEDPTLFSMSARENLTLGRPDASEADIAEAVEVAQAQFVYELPWGLDTRIGEQGMSLSGGQRQRLALARAVLAKPPCWCSTTRCRRWTSTPRRWSRRRCGGCWRASPASGRRPPRLDGAAGRPGRGALRRHDHPRRHPRRAAGRPCRSTASLLSAEYAEERVRMSDA